MKKILTDLEVAGFDKSKYGIENAKPELKKYLFNHDAKDKFPFKDKSFDLVISVASLHNLMLSDLESSLREVERVGKKAYIMVESYRNEQELFNLQCWALTCECFLHTDGWKWVFQKCKYFGDYEFIYFE